MLVENLVQVHTPHQVDYTVLVLLLLMHLVLDLMLQLIVEVKLTMHLFKEELPEYLKAKVQMQNSLENLG